MATTVERIIIRNPSVVSGVSVSDKIIAKRHETTRPETTSKCGMKIINLRKDVSKFPYSEEKVVAHHSMVVDHTIFVVRE